MSNSRQNVLIVLGTRPEAIKLAPVIVGLRKRPEKFTVSVATTGQHHDLVAPILDFFEISPDYDLGIMQSDQTPASIVERTLARLDPILEEQRFDRLIVQGDTSSALAAGLAGFYRKIPVAHVEAGLRSGEWDDPFPEEINRRLIAQLADLHFAPTEGNRDYLLREGISQKRIHITGNTVIDALHAIIDRTKDEDIHEEIEDLEGKKIILLTTHRRENFGKRQQGIFEAINSLLELHDDLAVIFPVHPNPNVRSTVQDVLCPNKRLHLLDPVDYIRFVRLMKASWLIMTDSGGIQEEAPALGVPVFVTRKTTERKEVLETGNSLLVGTSSDIIVQEVEALFKDEEKYKSMARPAFPFGQGGAVEKIQALLFQK